MKARQSYKPPAKSVEEVEEQQQDGKIAKLKEKYSIRPNTVENDILIQKERRKKR